MSELKPCPFCGEGKPELQDSGDPSTTAYDHSFCSIVCSTYEGGCGAVGGWKPTAQEAIEAWNKRADPPKEDKG